MQYNYLDEYFPLFEATAISLYSDPGTKFNTRKATIEPY